MGKTRLKDEVVDRPPSCWSQPGCSFPSRIWRIRPEPARWRKKPSPGQWQQGQQRQPRQRRRRSMWRGQPSEPQLQRTRLPRVLATWLHLVHSEPGGELLPSQRDETDLDRQQREGERVLGSRRQGEAEVLLDWRQRERQEHQVAKRQEV